MLSDKKIEKLQEMGASRWTAGDHDRLYLNGAAAKLIGLELHYYNSGNVSSATLDGEKISNRRANELNSVTSIYIDLKVGKMRGDVTQDQFDMIREKIKELGA